jgi:chromosome segregation ATPase
MTMADDDIPDNVDLRFLATQNARILRELGELRELAKPIPQMSKDLSELQMTVTTMRADQGPANEQLDRIEDAQHLHGGRLNTIDARLATIEQHTGLVKT